MRPTPLPTLVTAIARLPDLVVVTKGNPACLRKRALGEEICRAAPTYFMLNGTPTASKAAVGALFSGGGLVPFGHSNHKIRRYVSAERGDLTQQSRPDRKPLCAFACQVAGRIA